MSLAERGLEFAQEQAAPAMRAKMERTARIKDAIHRRKHQLNLTDWDIRFDPGHPPEKVATANVTFSDSDKAAVIYVLEELDFQRAEAAVTHELLHVAMRDVSVQAHRLLVHVRDGRSRVHFQEMLDDAEEQLIETLTRALVQGAPRVIVEGPDRQKEAWAVFA